MNRDRCNPNPRRTFLKFGAAGALLLTASACGALHDVMPAPTQNESLSMGVQPSQNEPVPTNTKPSQKAAKPVQITNILGYKVELSDNPDFLDVRHSRGFVDVGATAIAECLVINKNYPDSSSIYMKTAAGAEGFAGISSPGSKDFEGVQEFSLNYSQLRAALPDCFPPAK